MLKNNKGITLIALVITIIVLLILAGVSIAMLTGENGILTQATKSVDATELAEAKERASLDVNALIAEYYETVYVNNVSTYSNARDYINAKIESSTDYYTYSSTTHTITLKADTSVTGTIAESGGITWSDE